MRKIIVAGTRTFTDAALLKSTLDGLTRKLDKFEMVLGPTPKGGVERLAEKWAFTNRQKISCIKKFHAEWNTHGKKAGPIRNSEMIAYVGKGGVLIAFWDGESPGTEDILTKAYRVGLQVKLISI